MYRTDGLCVGGRCRERKDCVIGPHVLWVDGEGEKNDRYLMIVSPKMLHIKAYPSKFSLEGVQKGTFLWLAVLFAHETKEGVDSSR